MNDEFVTSTVITREDDLSQQAPPFVVDGIIHSTITLIYGQTLAGKSTIAGALAVALANGDNEFLGRAVALDSRRVGIIVGDPGGANEYRRRVKDYLNPGVQICVDSPYRPTRPGTWPRLHEVAEECGYAFVIVDNLSAFVSGSLSDDNSIKALYEQIEWFPRNGIPVLIVAHTSEKSGEYGYSRVPMGSSLIRFGPRWWGYMYRARGSAVIDFDGNEGSPHRLILSEPDGTPTFDVLAVEDELAARRKRLDETRRKADEMRAFILSECQAFNASATADKLAARFGGAASTHRGQLSRKAYGVERIDDQWRSLAP